MRRDKSGRARLSHARSRSSSIGLFLYTFAIDRGFAIGADSRGDVIVTKVIATLNLDGDGKLEVVVGSMSYEGEAITIYRCELKKVEALLSVSCGV